MGLENRDWYRDDFKQRAALKTARARTANVGGWASDSPRPGARRLPWFLLGFVVGAVALECFRRFA